MGEDFDSGAFAVDIDVECVQVENSIKLYVYVSIAQKQVVMKACTSGWFVHIHYFDKMSIKY